MPPLTKLWFIQLQPSISLSSPLFLSTWTSLLSFCNSQTPNPTHTLWLDTSDGQAQTQAQAQKQKQKQNLVFISGYPDQESADRADALYVRQFQDAIVQTVRHRKILQLPVPYESIVKQKDGRLLLEIGGSREDGVSDVWGLRDGGSQELGDVVWFEFLPAEEERGCEGERCERSVLVYVMG